jgi:hypothetical protein
MRMPVLGEHTNYELGSQHTLRTWPSITKRWTATKSGIEGDPTVQNPEIIEHPDITLSKAFVIHLWGQGNFETILIPQSADIEVTVGIEAHHAVPPTPQKESREK